MPTLKIFLPGEFLEADRKRKEQEETERKPVLLVENETGKPLGDLRIALYKTSRPGPNPEDMKQHAADPTQKIETTLLGPRVTDTDASANSEKIRARYVDLGCDGSYHHIGLYVFILQRSY